MPSTTDKTDPALQNSSCHMDTDPFTVGNSEENISVLYFKMIFYQLMKARIIMTRNPKYRTTSI